MLPTSGALERGERYRGLSEWGTWWEGTLDSIEPDRHLESDDLYAYFVDGHLGGIAQGCHGRPLEKALEDIARAKVKA